MSPSANNFATKLGRDLEQGDVLLRRSTFDTEHYEVVSPHIAGKRKTILGLWGVKLETDCVEVRELTQHGPREQTRLYSRDENRWNDVIRTENRTDRPSLRER